MRLHKTFQIEAAHRLPHVPAGHKCARMHGHSFRIKVHVEGPLDPTLGWVVDFADVKAAFAPLFDALADTTPAPDAALPDTGVGLELERLLSPPFVRGARYGTRCSTVVLVDDDTITFVERRFGPDAQPLGDSLVVVPLIA